MKPPSGTLSDWDLSGDKMSAERFRRIATRIEADPNLLAIPLTNIDRWLENGHSAKERLEGWKRLILDAQKSEAAMEELLFILRDQGWESMQWKGFSPFPGVLTKTDIDELSWTSRH